MHEHTLEESSSSISPRHVPVSIHFAALESVDRDWMAIVTISKVDCAGHLEKSNGNLPAPCPVEHYSPPPLKTEHRRFSPTSLHISARGIRDSSRGPIELSRMAVTAASSDKCFQASWNNSEEWKCLVNFYHLSCTRFQIRVHY